MNLPNNVRVGDYVEVESRDNKHFGLIGKITELLDSDVKVDIFGKIESIPRSDLKLKARSGSGTHDEVTNQIAAQDSHLDAEGLDELINLAIDMQEWAWATELVERKKQLKKVNK